MADVVNARLERMLPELDELEKWGLFSRGEIKEIVRRRRLFEYQLQRQCRVKDDFIRYIDYEKLLESLKSIRKKAVLVDLEAANKQWKGYLCDFAPIDRIIGIYKRAVTKFNGDLGLWFQYLEFCRLKSPKQIRRALAKALQQHPNVPGLWMYAASWDLECNLNVTAARALMQQGIRMCPHSEDLWLEYFRMELTYAHKLKSRKIVLGIEEAAAASDPEAELGVKLARVILRSALAAVPSSLRLRQRFVEALSQFKPVLSTVVIEEEILESMVKDFSDKEDCWDWIARRRCLNDAAAWELAVKDYGDALRFVPSPRMFELHANFLETLLTREELDMAEKKRIIRKLLGLFELGEKTCPSVNLVEAHILLLSRTGKSEKARELAARFSAEGPLVASGRIWALRLGSELQCGLLQTEDIAGLFLKALRQVDISDGGELWRMALEFFLGKKSYSASVLELLELKLGGKGGGQAGADVACSAVDWFLHSNGVEKARQVYDRLLVLPRPSLKLFKHCIALERARESLGDQEALGRIRRVFDAAIEIYGQEDIELWLEYCLQERKAGSTDAASSVYYRAKKTLQDPAQFVQRHQLLVS